MNPQKAVSTFDKNEMKMKRCPVFLPTQWSRNNGFQQVDSIVTQRQLCYETERELVQVSIDAETDLNNRAGK